MYKPSSVGNSYQSAVRPRDEVVLPSLFHFHKYSGYLSHAFKNTAGL